MKALIEKIDEAIKRLEDYSGGDDFIDGISISVGEFRDLKKDVLAEQKRIIKELEAYDCEQSPESNGCNDGIQAAIKIVKGEQ